jgi:hypothetical protein
MLLKSYADAYMHTYRLAHENNLWKRKRGLMGIWGGIIEQVNVPNMIEQIHSHNKKIHRINTFISSILGQMH